MKVLIVGGVAGGMSAATRLRRLMEDAGNHCSRERSLCVLCELRPSLLLSQVKLLLAINYYCKHQSP